MPEMVTEVAVAQNDMLSLFYLDIFKVNMLHYTPYFQTESHKIFQNMKYQKVE